MVTNGIALPFAAHQPVHVEIQHEAEVARVEADGRTARYIGVLVLEVMHTMPTEENLHRGLQVWIVIGISSQVGVVCGTLGRQRAGRADRAPGHSRAGEVVAWWRYLTGRVSCGVLPPRLQRPGCGAEGPSAPPRSRRHVVAAPVPYRPGRSLIETHAHDAVVEGDGAPRIEQVSPERGRVVAHRAVGEGQGPAVGVEDAPAASAAPIGLVTGDGGVIHRHLTGEVHDAAAAEAAGV